MDNQALRSSIIPVRVKKTFEKLPLLDVVRSLHHDRFGVARLVDEHASATEHYEAGSSFGIRYDDPRGSQEHIFFPTDGERRLPFSIEQLIALASREVIEIDLDKLRQHIQASVAAFPPAPLPENRV